MEKIRNAYILGTDHTEVGCQGVKWIDVVQDTV
jgi:hypothetical protein